MEKLLSLVNDQRIRLIVLIFAGILAAGLSGLLYPSNYTPLIFFGGMVIVAASGLFLWKPELALYTALLVVLLPGGLLPASVHSLLNRLLTILAFGVWCFDLVFRRRKVTLTASSVAMLAFIIWGAVSILWTEHVSTALTAIQMYTMRFLLFLVLIPNEIRTRGKLNGLFGAVAIVGWILVLTSIVTLLQQGYAAGTRFKLVDANENAIGMLALVASVGVLWPATYKSSIRGLPPSVLSFLYIIFMIGLIGISGSRGSMLSLVIALLAFSYGRVTRRWAKISMAIVLIILLVAPTTFLTTFERFTESSTDNLAILGGRAALWQAAWQVIVDHPYVGVGIGNSSYAIMPYLWMVSTSVGRDSVAMHNPVLVVSSELGIFGILLYLGTAAYAVRSFLYQYSRYKKLNVDGTFMSYFALVGSICLGYIASWIKGGGAEGDRLFFLLIALLLIPAHLDLTTMISKDPPAEVNPVS